MSASLATFLFETANFLLLVGVLGWAFFRPVRRALARRREALAAEKQEAAGLRQEAEAGFAELTARRRRFEASLDDLREEARAEGKQEAERVVEEAHARMQRERDALKAELTAQRRDNARALTRDAAATARAVLERLLERIDGPDLEGALARAACRELRERAPEARGEALGTVIVESATPLDEAGRARIRDALELPAEGPRFRVVPELVAGTRILTGVGVADASAAALARRVADELVRGLEREEPEEPAESETSAARDPEAPSEEAQPARRGEPGS